MLGPLGFLLAGVFVLYKEKRERSKKALKQRRSNIHVYTRPITSHPFSIPKPDRGWGLEIAISKAQCRGVVGLCCWEDDGNKQNYQ